jgi:hypothetical protein
MTQPDSKYVTSSRPVNQRTTSRRLLREEPLKPIVRERLESAKARSRFGLPLAEQISTSASTAQRVPIGALTIVGGIFAAISLMGLLLAWIQFSWMFAASGLVGLVAGTGLIFREHRVRHSASLSAVTAPLFEDASLHAFDRMLEKAALEVPENIALQLGEIKQLVVRISRHVRSAACDENFTMDHRMYLIECVRRYLPDSLQSYLLIPAQQRTLVAIEGSNTAAVLLGNQLTLILVELKKCESKITQTSAEKLLRQQRFLESKRS